MFLLDTMPSITSETWSTVFNTILSWCLNTGIKIVISIIILIVGLRIINVLARNIQKRIQNNDKYDKTIVKTLTYVGKIAAKILLFICIIGYLGIDTSGLTALVASLGVCVGLAVNGALSNLAGGVLILFTRPFKVDDYIEAMVDPAVSGTVEDIQIVCTKLRTPDNKVIYIPNGTLSNAHIVNYSEKELRRVDFSFSIAYDNDVEIAKAAILTVCDAHTLVLDDPAPFVRVSEYGQNSIDIVARVWVKSEDYWTVKFDILETVKKVFDESEITIPYNQLDVHIKKD
ncbi:MAG: mechanosensitive ion channel [Clostridia bacterium]|nr:mechanosensitive ion channel [Clostridia bacterium]